MNELLECLRTAIQERAEELADRRKAAENGERDYAYFNYWQIERAEKAEQAFLSALDAHIDARIKHYIDVKEGASWG